MSRPVCLVTGVMNEAGHCPMTMERLNNSAMYGTIRSITCFKTDVGIGSAVDDLSGRRRTALITSSTFTNEKVENETSCRLWLIIGSVASLVLDRTLSTFSVRYRLFQPNSLVFDFSLIKRQLTSIAFEDPIDQHRSSYARTPHFHDDIADDREQTIKTTLIVPRFLCSRDRSSVLTRCTFKLTTRAFSVSTCFVIVWVGWSRSTDEWTLSK